MTHIAIDKATGDLLLKTGGGLQYVDKGRLAIQQVTSKLKTILGEWMLDEQVGYINFEDFEKNPDLYAIESRAREIILGTQGVSRILNMSLVLRNRSLTITFQAQTIYGEIDVTVPWDNIQPRT